MQKERKKNTVSSSNSVIIPSQCFKLGHPLYGPVTAMFLFSMFTHIYVQNTKADVMLMIQQNFLFPPFLVSDFIVEDLRFFQTDFSVDKNH